MRKLLLVGGLLALALPSSAPATAKTPAGVLVVAKNIDDIVSLDPGTGLRVHQRRGGRQHLRPPRRVQSGRTSRSSIPRLAESWTVSDDGKTITFKLRPGAKFSSGNPVRPEDVVFSFKPCHRAQ